jgi:type VI secretion system secreted protein VgrG
VAVFAEEFLMTVDLFGPITITGPASVPMTFLAMSASEGLGRCFEFFIDVVSPRSDVNAKDLVGQPVRVDMEVKNFQLRYFHGLVAGLEYGGTNTRGSMYRLVVRPWLWFLTRSNDCRIFHNMSTTDILKKVFEKHAGQTDLSFLQGNYPVREFVVQYRESDFHFVTRLMEAEGIYYFFRHGEQKHEMVLVDTYTSHEPVPDYGTLQYMTADAHRNALDEYVSHWSLLKEAQPGIYTQRDYDFTKANVELNSTSSVLKQYTLDNLEFYDYPGGFATTAVGDAYSRIRLEQLQVRFAQAHGTSNARGLTVGQTFNLVDHPREDQNQEYLVVSAESRLRGQDPTTGGGAVEQPFVCTFTALDTETQFRMPPTVTKPLMGGPQTATVVGPANSEIATDEYGRVRVQFHWDREGKLDENSSCFVRVSQIWAGTGWGAVFTPRIGQEVIVDFLEGDPDQPIIVGRVHNSVNMPPYHPKEHPTVSGIRTQSSPKGAATNFNEIRFEDLKGQEELRVTAENLQTTLVKGNQNITIGANRTRTVKLDDTTTVGGDVQHIFHGMQTVKVESDRIIIVDKGDQFLRTNEGSITLVHKDSAINIAKGEDTTIVTKNASILVSQTGDIKITNAGGTLMMLKDGSMFLQNTSGALTISQVDNTIDLTDGKISIQAKSEIEVTSKGKVTIHADDTVAIDAKEVDITGTSEVKIGVGSSSVDLTSSGATVTASMIKLNA